MSGSYFKSYLKLFNFFLPFFQYLLDFWYLYEIVFICSVHM